METIHKNNLQNRMDKESKRWIVTVKNKEAAEGLEMEVTTNFFSESCGFENVLHKVELDLMTNLHYGFETPIEVRIKEVK